MNKGIVFEKYGSISQLKLTEVPSPGTTENHAVEKIKAIGLNPRDISILEGKFKFLTGKKFPKLTGADFSGEIVDLPSTAGGFSVGDEVFGYYESLNGGTSAQYCEIPIKFLIKKPPEISHEIAASLGCTYLTAYQALFIKAKINKGDKVLIYGASGGVGTAAMHLAKVKGATITAISHSKNKAYCLEQGADFFMAYDEEHIFESAEKFDLFFQVFSDQGSFYTRGKHMVKKDGVYLCLIPNPFFALLKLLRKPKFDYLLVAANPFQLLEIANWVVKGKIKPRIEKVFRPEAYLEAFQALKSGKIRGKAIVAFEK